MISSARKMLALLDRAEYWKLALIVVAMIVAGILQAAGIASIMPFLAMVAHPEVVNQNPILARAYQHFGFTSPTQFLFALGVFFLAAVTIANGFGALVTWVTLRFHWRNHHRISQRLLRRYLSQPYGFFVHRNTARLGKTLLSQVNKVISGVLEPMTQILATTIAAAFIIGLLVVVNPGLTLLAAGGLGGTYALVYLLVRGKQRRLGMEELIAKTARYKVAAETFGGIKEVKVLGRERDFLQRFSDPSFRYSRAHAAHAVIGQLPRYALETLAFGAVVVVVLYLLRTRETLDQIFPVLAVYAMAANRLVPYLQQILGGLTRIQYHNAVLDDLHADMHEPDARRPARGVTPAIAAGSGPAAPLRLTREIRFENVTFNYPEAGAPALRNLNLVIPAKTTLGIVGATGSGKTTLVDLLLGLYEPTQGSIRIDDVPLNAQNVDAWRMNVGYVPQTIFLCDDSITRNIAFGLPDHAIDQAAVVAAGRAAQLDEFVSTLRAGYDTVVGERGVRLSGGQRQRIGIARALYRNPDVLVLDEATSALDNVTEDVVMEALRQLAHRRTVILIAHRLTTVEMADVICLVEQGSVSAHGTYESLASTNATFRAMARL